MGFGFEAFRYWAGTGLSRTMKFSVLVSASSEHHLAVGTWISRGGRNVDGGVRSADVITALNCSATLQVLGATI